MIKSLLSFLALFLVLNSSLADPTYHVPKDDLVKDHDKINIIGHNVSGTKLYGIDVTAIKENQDILSTLVLQFYLAKDDTIHVGVSRVEFNCKNQTIKVINAVVQDSNLNVIAEKKIEDKFEPPVPGTSDEPLFKYICDKEYLKPKKEITEI